MGPHKEDTVNKLKELDDEYLAIEREYLRAKEELQVRLMEKQQVLCNMRMKLLTKTDGVGTTLPGFWKQAMKHFPNLEDRIKLLTGTTLPDFWKQAMKHFPDLEDQIQEWDEAVLDYCRDVRKSWLDESDLAKGFKLSFHFEPNPYFTNTELWKEYHEHIDSPYTQKESIKEIKASAIEWKSGKDITVAKVAKCQVPKKKEVQTSELVRDHRGFHVETRPQPKGKVELTVEPRDSFFRRFFRNLKEDGGIPEGLTSEETQELVDEDVDDRQLLALLMEKELGDG